MREVSKKLKLKITKIKIRDSSVSKKTSTKDQKIEEKLISQLVDTKKELEIFSQECSFWINTTKKMNYEFQFTR